MYSLHNDNISLVAPGSDNPCIRGMGLVEASPMDILAIIKDPHRRQCMYCIFFISLFVLSVFSSTYISFETFVLVIMFISICDCDRIELVLQIFFVAKFRNTT